MRTVTISLVVLLLACGSASGEEPTKEASQKTEPNRPKLQGTFLLNQRCPSIESRDLTHVVEGSDGP
jgi:hypothetical protein